VKAAPEVYLVETHDRALRAWRDEGARAHALVHVDAHHDCWHADQNDPVTAANFVAHAAREGLIAAVYWVVPDATWDRAHLAALRSHLASLGRKFPRASEVTQTAPHRIELTLDDTRLIACDIESLDCRDPVVLDIDTDFLVVPRATGTAISDRLWSSPAQLLGRLQATGLRWDLATVAYSVEGGHTPLIWKFLGDELAVRLRGGPGGAFDVLHTAQWAQQRGDEEAAAAIYATVCERPGAAGVAARYRLALLHLRAGRFDKARAEWRQVLHADITYRTPYRSEGWVLAALGQLADAHHAHTSAHALDPDDVYPPLGLAIVAARRRDWASARRWAEAALERDNSLADAHRVLGVALERLGKFEAAIATYDRSIALSLSGRLRMSPGAENGRDLDLGRLHLTLARLRRRVHDVSGAMADYRMALAAGVGGERARSEMRALQKLSDPGTAT
jgi:hypothetical protein